MNKLGPMFNLAPGTVAKLDSRFGAIDPSWTQPAPPPPPGPVVQGNAHSPMGGAAPPPQSGPGPGGLFQYAQTLRDAPPDPGAPPVPAPAVPAPGPPRPTGGGEPGPQVTPSVVTPAHWQPGTHKLETERTEFDPTQLEAGGYNRDVASGLALSAADKRLEASQLAGQLDAEHYVRKQAASEAFAAKQAALADRRDQYIQTERAKLQDMSDRMKGDPTTNYWRDQGTAGTILAALGAGFGALGAALKGGPNEALRIIEGKIAQNMTSKKEAFGEAKGIYQQALSEFGDEGRAIEASKVAYYDQIGQMLEGQRSLVHTKEQEAAFLDLQKAIYEKKAAAADDLAKMTGHKLKEEDTEKFVPTQVSGGVSTKPLEHTITLPDGTVVQMPSSNIQEKALEKVNTIDQLQRMNNEALRIRQEISNMPWHERLAGSTEYHTAVKQLEDMEEKKASLMSTEAGQGVLRDSEYARSVSRQGFYTEGVGRLGFTWTGQKNFEVATRAMQAQNKRMTEDMRAMARNAGGRIVNQGYAQAPDGTLSPTGQYTGQDLKPKENLPPAGFQSYDQRHQVPTAPTPLRDVTPNAPILKRTGSAPAPAKKERK